jgi:hypothetical protein
LPSGIELFGVQSFGERKKCEEDVSLNLVGEKTNYQCECGFHEIGFSQVENKIEKIIWTFRTLNYK